MSTPTVRTHQLRTARAGRGATTDLGAFVTALIGDDPPVRIELFDGSALGPPRSEAPATVRVRSRDALRRMVTSPGELGLARAYVAGDLDVTGVHPGDPYELLRTLATELDLKRPPARVLLEPGLGWRWPAPSSRRCWSIASSRSRRRGWPGAGSGGDTPRQTRPRGENPASKTPLDQRRRR